MGRGVYIKTLGCKVNQAESSELDSHLSHLSIPVVDSIQNASTVVVNTCSVTERSDAKVRKEIRRALNQPGVTQVIATGCSAVIHRETLGALDKRVIVEPDKTRIAAHLEQTKRQLGSESVTTGIPRAQSRTRVNVKITDGCENYCSYCIVPYTRGPVTSVPTLEVIDRVKSLSAEGIREVVLTGINLGVYRDGESDLVGLIEALETQTRVERIRLSSIEPHTITDALIGLFSTSRALCHQVHIPLQSGSDRVLVDMNRRYDREQYRAIVTRLREVAPAIAIHGDVIVGYPTETDEDFACSEQFMQDINFAGAHLFKFSARPGTPAAGLSTLDPRIIEQRFERLRHIVLDSARRYREMRLTSGEKLEYLIERIDDRGISATSREHLSVLWEHETNPFPHARVGDIVRY